MSDVTEITHGLTPAARHIIGKMSTHFVHEAFYLRDETVWSPGPVLSALVKKGVVKIVGSRSPRTYRLTDPLGLAVRNHLKATGGAE